MYKLLYTLGAKHKGVKKMSVFLDQLLENLKRKSKIFYFNYIWDYHGIEYIQLY